MSSAKINDLTENKGLLTFTLKNVDVSIANGLRRTMISDIDTVVFRTTPYEKNDAEFKVNTSRFNNEILKQRLSCIPIHIKDIDGFPYDQYVCECSVKNETDEIIYVTTKDFMIRNILTGDFIDNDQKEKIFPKNTFTEEYIKFCRLRPKISDEIYGEEIQFTCKFSIGNCKENSMFNILSTCAYGNSLDIIKINETWDNIEKKYNSDGITKEEIEFNKTNWLAIDAKRIYEKNSFDFKVKTIGVFPNKYILTTACKKIIDRLSEIKSNIPEIQILPANVVNENSFDICLYNEGNTIGKILESIIYTRFFEKEKKILYVGYKKNHPHDDYCYIRVILEKDDDIDVLRKSILEKSLDDGITIYTEIKNQI